MKYRAMLFLLQRAAPASAHHTNTICLFRFFFSFRSSVISFYTIRLSYCLFCALGSVSTCSPARSSFCCSLFLFAAAVFFFLSLLRCFLFAFNFYLSIYLLWPKFSHLLRNFRNNNKTKRKLERVLNKRISGFLKSEIIIVIMQTIAFYRSEKDTAKCIEMSRNRDLESTRVIFIGSRLKVKLWLCEFLNGKFHLIVFRGEK